jgi:hypothetical protein
MWKRLVMVLVIVALSSAVYADQKTEEILVVASAAADVVSTEIWLRHDVATEANPLMQSRATRIVSKAAGTAGLLYLGRWLDNRGNDKAASFVRLTAASVWLTATGWNVSLTIRY